jgi:hypothetical protein
LSILPLLMAWPLASCAGSSPASETPSPAAGQAPAAAGEPEPELMPEPESAEPAGAAEPASDGSSDAPADVDKPALSDGETRTMSMIQKVVLDNRTAFRTCYDAVQAKVPELKGDLTLYFVLDAGGRVKKAELNEQRSTIKNDELTQCAIGELRKLQFPASSKGLDTKVNYPFNFNPQ